MSALSKDTNGVIVPSFGPATDGIAITPADATDLTPNKIKGIWVGVAGTVLVVGINGTATLTFTAPAGAIIPIMPKTVKTASTASGLVGLI